MCFSEVRKSAAAAVLLVIASRFSMAKPAAQSDPSTALRDYVSRPDDSYAWKERRRGPLGSGRFAELILTSQTWRGIVWKHQLFVYHPAKVRDGAQALLLIDGGSWSDKLEAPPSGEESLPDKAQVFAALADMIETPVAIVRQVPQQPMFDGRKEDQIIALTFAKYLETKDLDWPLLLPMVKSAVRAMDTVQQFAHQQWHTDIARFTVTGASKRGWTTWLTAATDPRVNALAPMVINMLNMVAHDKLQRESFGGYSEEIHDYTERNLHEKLFTEPGAALRTIVDPYSYRANVTQPKLIILATNDAYWPVDSLNLYWNDLEGDKYVLYVPNNGHGIRDYPRVLGTLAALQRSLTGGKPLPKLTWQLDDSSDTMRLVLKSDTRPLAVRKWTAAADTRDFRKAEWSATRVARDGGANNAFVAKLANPDHGFNAMFLEAEFAGEPMSFTLSTTLHVSGPTAAADDSDKSGT
jgi:PhoPQ-activated pathogenicity-related protein